MGNQEKMLMVREIVRYALNVLERTSQYDGIILCEGNTDSVDVRLYQAVYPSLLVIPVGGWSDVKNFVFMVRRRMMGYPTYGIIDRDSLSKSEVRKLKKIGIYCTKLPFIENVISCPQIISILCEKYDKDYDRTLDSIRKRLMQTLSKKLRSALPINIAIDPDEPLQSITVRIKRQDGTIVEKTVDDSNIIYAYRDKAVANETSDVLGIVGRKQYYKFLSKALDDPELRERIVRCATSYLPEIDMTLFDII